MEPLIVIAGCGALGSLIARNLASNEYRFHLIDMDIVEEGNVGLSAYHEYNIDDKKVSVLEEILHNLGSGATNIHDEATKQEHILPKEEAALAIVSFDNVDARGLCVDLGVPTLHVAIAANRDQVTEGDMHPTGEIRWDDDYELPSGNIEPMCTRAIGKRIILLTSTLASVVAMNFLENGVKETVIISETMNVYR